MPDDVPEVSAAGGVLWRRRPPTSAGEIEVLIVHRPAPRDDWSFPKGKVESDDGTLVDTARREVHEETGIWSQVGDELARVYYRDRAQRFKEVTYFLMTGDGPFVANDEVDDARWVSLAEAACQLSYDSDRTVVEKVRAVLAASP